MAGLSLRNALAFIIGGAVYCVWGSAGLDIKRHWKLYLAASINLFQAMALVYAAAQYISSGFIALLFGIHKKSRGIWRQRFIRKIQHGPAACWIWWISNTSRCRVALKARCSEGTRLAARSM